MNNIFIATLIFVSIFTSNIISQSSSELVQTGFTNYQNGDYQAAVKSFDKALQNYNSSTTVAVTTQSRESLGSEDNKTDADISKRELTQTSEKNYSDVLREN